MNQELLPMCLIIIILSTNLFIYVININIMLFDILLFHKEFLFGYVIVL